VHIYPNCLEILNSGNLPEGMSQEDLLKGHISILRNPDIAHVLYLRGRMEKLGRGCVMIRKACEEYGIRPPEWRADANAGVTLTFFAPEVSTEDTTEVAMEVRAVLKVLDGTMTRQELQEKLGLKNAEHFRKHYLVPALEGGFVEMTIPDKPRSRMQRYRLTALGRRALANGGKDA
jgi:ATP-dependent DNA helicase RecG